jgi:hypothetical protein
MSYTPESEQIHVEAETLKQAINAFIEKAGNRIRNPEGWKADHRAKLHLLRQKLLDAECLLVEVEG